MDYPQKGRNSKWVMLQGWENMLFLHWPVSPNMIQPFLPKGLELDTYNGQAWISIVTFKVFTSRLIYLPKIPYIPAMLQVNVRTYVRKKGERGIYFFTVDTNKLSAVLAAKLVALPYYRAKMKMKEFGEMYYFESLRQGEIPAKWKVKYEPGDIMYEPERKSLDYWLLERYILWSYKNETLYRSDIKHTNWLVSDVEFNIEENSLFEFLPMADVEYPSIAHYATSKVCLNWIPMKVK